MKEFVISEVQAETAVLVGLITKTQDERKTNEYLDELEFLAETAGAEVVKRFTQKLDQAHSVTYVGKGYRPAKKTAIRNLCTDYISHLAPGVTSQGNLNHQPLNRHLLSSCLRKISELSCICLFFPRWKE